MSQAGCPFCSSERPAADHRIAELGLTTAYLHDDQFFPGWVVVVLKRHATELFHLERSERARMLDEVTRIAGVIQEVYAPKKINYELLGNQVPHIHWHVIPRRADDPAPHDAVWTVPHVPRRLDGAVLAERIATLRARLA